MKIYKCELNFKYSTYYISIILISENYEDAKNKFITKCLEKYKDIMLIDFEMFYDKDVHTIPPTKFQNYDDFKKYLIENISE